MECYTDRMVQMVQDGMVRHGVVRDSIASPQFKTIEEIQCNLGSLGQRKQVFIWFAPSKITADNTTPPGILETRVFLFSRHLKTYGFQVKTNLSAGINRTSIADRASSADREMSQAEWIICVCSQSLYEMFHNICDPMEIHSLNINASFLNRTLYNRLLNDPTSQVIPVILQEVDNNLCFVPPTLRDPKNILHIYEETPFDVNNFNGDFERLICLMAGIDRMALRFAENDHHQGFVKLPLKIPPG